MGNPDDLPKIAKVLNPLMKKHKLIAQFPMPVWDDTGTLTGIQILKPIKKGEKDCVAIASFVVTPREIADAKKLTAKAQIAVDAINNEIQMQIRLGVINAEKKKDEPEPAKAEG